MPCTAAVDARKEWRKRVRAAFGASGEISWLSQAAPSLAVVARCLGGGGRGQVSKWLARIQVKFKSSQVKAGSRDEKNRVIYGSAPGLL